MEFKDHIDRYLNKQMEPKGEPRCAVWLVQLRELRFFNSRNTEIMAYCTSLRQANTIIKKSGIQQELSILR